MQQLIDKHLLTTIRLVLLLSSLYIWGHWGTEIWLRLFPCGHSNPVGQVPKSWSQPLYYCPSLTCWVSSPCCQSEISVSLCTPLTWSGCGSYPCARGTSSWGSALCPALEELSVPSKTMSLCLKPPKPILGYLSCQQVERRSPGSGLTQWSQCQPETLNFCFVYLGSILILIW